MVFGDLSRSEVEHLIDEWCFSERNRKILKRRYLDSIRIEPLSEEIGLSVRQIKKIISDETKRLMAHIKGE